jgi:hypothetical protein
VNRQTQGFLGRADDVFADDSGQYGLSARYFAEWADGAEFAAYYQNYHSRLPYLNVVRGGGVRQLGYRVTGESVNLPSVSSRGLVGTGGCGINQLNLPAVQVMLGDGPGVIAVKNATFGAIVTGTLNNNAAIPAAQRDFMKSTRVNDPGGILAGAAGTLTAHGITLHNDVVGGTGINNAWNVLQLNCALQYYQTANINLGTGNNLLGVDGAETLLGFGDGAVSF